MEDLKDESLHKLNFEDIPAPKKISTIIGLFILFYFFKTMTHK